jgi:hypothetical protein
MVCNLRYFSGLLKQIDKKISTGTSQQYGNYSFKLLFSNRKGSNCFTLSITYMLAVP